MKFILNTIWFFTVGVLLFSLWSILGFVLCCTVFGLPLGLWCFNKAKNSLTLFKRAKVYKVKVYQ